MMRPPGPPCKKMTGSGAAVALGVLKMATARRIFPLAGLLRSSGSEREPHRTFLPATNVPPSANGHVPHASACAPVCVVAVAAGVLLWLHGAAQALSASATIATTVKPHVRPFARTTLIYFPPGSFSGSHSALRITLYRGTSAAV